MDIYKIYFGIQKKIHGFFQYYKKNGGLKTAQHFFCRIWETAKTVVLRKEEFVFFALNIQDVSFNKNRTTNYNLVPAKKNDIRVQNEYFDGWFNKSLAIRRLQQGYVLLTIKDNERMIFFQWFEFERVYIPAIDLLFSIPETTAYMAYTYTQPEYRGKKIASMAKPMALEYLQKCGYKKVFLMIAPENAASVKVNRGVGFKEYQELYYKRYFMFLKYYCIKDFDSDRKKVFWHIRKTDHEIWKMFLKNDF
jgi:RimJ/RimL family protein N-acetyltransferase